jgi:hypothetical protein
VCECRWNTAYLTLDISQLINILIFSIYQFWFRTRLSQVYFNYHLIIIQLYIFIRKTNLQIINYLGEKRWYWYGPKSASLDRLLIKVTWIVFQLHSWRKQVSNNIPLGNFYICQPVTYLSIGVTARCFLTYKERNILIRWATHWCPVRRASGISDSSNTIRGLLFRKWSYPLYSLGTPPDIFFLLFSAMHFFKVRKIINYLPTHLKSGNMNPAWPNTMFQAKWHRFNVTNSYSYLLLTPSERLCQLCHRE